MADHYLQTVALLDELTDIDAELNRLYAEPRIPAANGGVRIAPHVQRQLNDLHSRRGIVLKTAEINSNLAAAQMIAQAIRDVPGAMP